MILLLCNPKDPNSNYTMLLGPFFRVGNRGVYNKNKVRKVIGFELICLQLERVRYSIHKIGERV